MYMYVCLVWCFPNSEGFREGGKQGMIKVANPIRDEIIIIVKITVNIAIVITIQIPKTGAIALQRLWP